MSMVEMLRFRRDPLGFVEDYSHRIPSDVFRLPWGAWCVGDSELALVVLRDPAFNAGMATGGDLRPFVTNAAICRPFVLHRTTKAPWRHTRWEGGEQP
ncbi:hypothetical protein IPZ58_16845 [Streptomyces roseoverticillatus]|uniref:hypothetical protein n=1 Tax=Streptomyces roseoverticillatus TaxID=66429 RepID=UPI001F295434|nr:hypothetical protein [Streptomyces roseoverticillatus]MCF3103234.1 hypothetical protein [Streptomyces roseoverticillatus]